MVEVSFSSGPYYRKTQRPNYAPLCLILAVLLLLLYAGGAVGCAAVDVDPVEPIDLAPVMGSLEEQAVITTQNFAVVAEQLRLLRRQQELIIVALQRAGVRVDLVVWDAPEYSEGGTQ